MEYGPGVYVVEDLIYMHLFGDELCIVIDGR